MKFVTKFVIFSFGILFLLQFIRPAIPVKSSEAELDAPDAVKHVFEKDCYSCHSSGTTCVRSMFASQ
jgi:mono/diheme cytochrome c family protein